MSRSNAVLRTAIPAPGKPKARIYQRERSPMQAGQARESNWLLTFEPRDRTEIDFLMGWTGSRDTLQQVELRFPTLDEAVAFAEGRGFHYEVETPGGAKVGQRPTPANSDMAGFTPGRTATWQLAFMSDPAPKPVRQRQRRTAMTTVRKTEPSGLAAAPEATTSQVHAEMERADRMDPVRPAPWDAVDQASIDSFPASDPPAWTCGVDTADRPAGIS